MNTVTVDRLEGDVVVLEREDGVTFQVPRLSLPPETAAGDVLREEDGRFVSDPGETSRRRAAAFSLEQKLRNKFRT